MKSRTQGSRAGIVLFAVLAVLAALAILAATVAAVAKADLRITRHFKDAVEAVTAAEAGVEYVRDRIAAALAGGSLTLSGPSVTVNFVPAGNLRFDPVTQLTQVGRTNMYAFLVTGRARDAKVTLEAVIRRNHLVNLGLFGDQDLQLQPQAQVYSYSSEENPNPTPGDSTGEAWAGSNLSVTTHEGTYINGSFELGQSLTGQAGTWTEHPQGGSIITGDAAVPTTRTDPDPLGVQSGSLAADFLYYSTHNDNARAVPAITAPRNVIDLKNRDTMTLTSGHYYVNKIALDNGASLTFNSSAGTIYIYLAGVMDAKQGSTINFTGNPTGLMIFSNSSDGITLKNSGVFKGLIYAPLADVHALNTSDLYGLVWGRTVEVKNSGRLYLDTALLDDFPANSVRLLSWKEMR